MARLNDSDVLIKNERERRLSMQRFYNSYRIDVSWCDKTLGFQFTIMIKMVKRFQVVLTHIVLKSMHGWRLYRKLTLLLGGVIDINKKCVALSQDEYQRCIDVIKKWFYARGCIGKAE